MRTATLRGFTLIELICVIAIIMVLTGLAVVQMDFMVPRYRLRAAARQVASHVKRARSQAAATGKDVYVKYDLGKGAYWLVMAFPKKDDSGAPTKEFVYEEIMRSTLPDGVEFVSVILGSKESFTSGQATVRVSPFGSTRHHIVNLKNKEGQEFALKVNGFTGAVSFYERRQEAPELLEDTGY